ncbi:hypothetical protein [Clostridium sp.]|uniref:hypothetical protein n=1 Tax=Clostridium sp. TaxID=1506 RepID=UPI002632C409|nr:hypothetical protein [Clostridium sp.]
MIKLLCPDCESDELQNVIDEEFGWVDVFICKCGKEFKLKEARWTFELDVK